MAAPCLSVVEQHCHLPAYFSVCMSPALTLQSLSEALAPSKSLDLTVGHDPSRYPSHRIVDTSSLVAVQSSLVKLSMQCISLVDLAVLSGVTTFARLTKLTGLTLSKYDFSSEEPWPALAALTSLKDLQLVVAAHGDPSLLSALTSLTSLYISSGRSQQAGDNAPPFRFSSLRPLSTMQQLVKLKMDGTGIAAIRKMAGLESLSSLQDLNMYWHGDASLRRLSGLSSLSCLRICDMGASRSSYSLARLKGIQGFSNCLKSLTLIRCMALRSLSGIESLTGLQNLGFESCGVTSLQPLLGLLAPGLKSVRILWCPKIPVEEKQLVFPHIAATAVVEIV